MPKRKRPPDYRQPVPRILRAPDGGAVTQTLLQVTHQAVAAYQRADWTEAERLCRLMLNAKADHFAGLHLLGIIATQTRRAQEAIALLSSAVAVDPNSADAHTNLGNVLRDLKRPEEALASYDRALEIQPESAETLNNRGNALRDLKRPAEALASYDRALGIKADYAEALNNRGNALSVLKRPEDALASYDSALGIKPHYAEALNNRGNALSDLKRSEEALASYDRALEIKANYAEALNNRGNALRDLTRPAEALASYERALTIKPDYVDALNNRGNALRDLKRPVEALASFDLALEIEPDNASSHWNLALCCLQLGDYPRGWQGYEWRWAEEQLQKSGRDFAQRLWLGAESLQGKTILLHSEQGLGDTLQFCRYTRRVAALGAKVVLEVQAPLLPLLAGLEGAIQVLAKGAVLPAFDCHCPLLSLPLAFKTDLHTIPAGVPYVRSDAARVGTWQDRLGSKTKPRVGVVWSGSTGHKNDHNRSLALAQMLPLLSDWAEVVSLQKEVRRTDADLLASRTDIRHFGDQLADFADTAALVELMDVVVTVDTSVTHLAGAMGKAVWILLPFNPDWRWLLDREDSVWYPTARLYRQPVIGDWASVMARVREQLEQQFRTRH